MPDINSIEFALLKQRVEGMERVMGKMEARDSKRIRAGVLALGTFILALFGVISTLGAYIWNITVGK